MEENEFTREIESHKGEQAARDSVEKMVRHKWNHDLNKCPMDTNIYVVNKGYQHVMQRTWEKGKFVFHGKSGFLVKPEAWKYI